MGLSVAIMSAFLMTTGSNVGATGMDSYKTIYSIRPGYPAQLTMHTDVVKCTLEGSKRGVMGPDTYCYFKNMGSLTKSFKAVTGREIHVWLMDDDGLFYSPDLLVDYTGRFTGRKLTYISYRNIDDYGYVDGQSDKTAELYLANEVDYYDGESDVAYVNNLYQYKYGVK